MEEEDNIIVKWAQEDVETSYNLLNNNKITFKLVINSRRISRGPVWLMLRRDKFFFHKTRARSQQIYSSVPFQFFLSSYIKLT